MKWPNENYLGGVLLSLLAMLALISAGIVSLMTVVTANPSLAMTNLVTIGLSIAFTLAFAIIWSVSFSSDLLTNSFSLPSTRFLIWYENSIPAIGIVSLILLPIEGSLFYIGFRYRHNLLKTPEAIPTPAQTKGLMAFAPYITSAGMTPSTQSPE